MRNRVGSKLDQSWSVILVTTILLGLYGCPKSEETKDKMFITDLKRIGATLESGQSAVVPVPPLEPNELLIVINGPYMGSLDPSEHISKELAMEANLDYATKGNYIIFARDQKIMSATGAGLFENFRTPWSQSNNAKVAHSGTRNAVLHCVPRETKLSPRDADDLWNPRCWIELVKFE